MQIEAKLFYLLLPFYLIVGAVYGFVTGWSEWVGVLALPLTGALAGMIGFYLAFTARRVGMRPEDRNDGEIEEGAGEQGHFSPWSWWPMVLAGGAAIAFLGLAVGWWIFFISLGLGIVGIIGWTFEYSRGDHAH